MSTQHVDELIDGYLLGALEAGEVLQVRAHLQACAACVSLLAESRAVLSALPHALDDLVPRPEVRRRLLEMAAADTEQAPVDATSAPDDDRRPIPLRPGRSRFAAWAPLGAAAAAVVVLIGGLAAWGIAQTNRLDDRDAELAQARRTLDNVVSSARVLTMRGTEAAPQVNAALVVSGDGEVLVLANNVPQPEPGAGYHLWLFDADGEPVHVILQPDENGQIVASLEANLARYDAMEVDVQPLDATEPGGVTVLAGELN